MLHGGGSGGRRDDVAYSPGPARRGRDEGSAFGGGYSAGCAEAAVPGGTLGGYSGAFPGGARGADAAPPALDTG